MKEEERIYGLLSGQIYFFPFISRGHKHTKGPFKCKFFPSKFPSTAEIESSSVRWCHQYVNKNSISTKELRTNSNNLPSH